MTTSMTTNQLEARALGDPTRHAIFRRIAEAANPISVAELNTEFAFNHNAIRQHLAKLVDAGLIIEAKAAPTGRGRPRLVYSLNPTVEGRWGTIGPYERLSRLLVEVAGTGRSAEEVGRRAASQFRVADPSGDIAEDVSAAMAKQGFDPEVRETSRGPEVVLHHCPFETAAVADRSIVCALHLGIAEGLVDGTDVMVDELIAYDPRRAGCRVHLRTATGEPDEERASDGTLTLRGSVAGR
jgi:predicted ArsR family transcriptional regulator